MIKTHTLDLLSFALSTHTASPRLSYSVLLIATNISSRWDLFGVKIKWNEQINQLRRSEMFVDMMSGATSSSGGTAQSIYGSVIASKVYFGVHQPC